MATHRRSSRLKPEERKRQILQAAAKLFADNGFDAGTSELAERLGIAQPLIYRYFRNKEDLLKQVYSERYLIDDYFSGWERLILDRKIPLRERLVEFYSDYSRITWDYESTRMAMWANLTRPEMNRVYFDAVRERIFPKIAREVRVDCGRGRDRSSPNAYELELVASLHGMMHHLAIRRWVHIKRITGDVRPLIELKVDLFLKGAADLITTSVRRSGSIGDPRIPTSVV